jgi:Gnt-I system low-affinity gluconate transporter
MDSTLLIAIGAGIAVLLVLILQFRIQAFLALLISSIVVGIIAGMEPIVIIQTIEKGMASTLGFVAVVVGLGAMFGAILEHSGGAEAVAAFLLKHFKEKGTSWALMLTGFFIAIPVFFDVAFIILVPMIYSLQRRSKKSLLLYPPYAWARSRSRYPRCRFGLGHSLWIYCGDSYGHCERPIIRALYRQTNSHRRSRIDRKN